MTEQIDEHVWPPVFISDAKRYTNRVWGDVRPALKPSDCWNCGGMGLMSAFYIGCPAVLGETLTISDINGTAHQGYRRWEPCPICHGNAGNARQSWLLEQCGLIGDELDVRLETFNPMTGKQAAKAEAARLLAMTPNPEGWVTLVGAYGVGKTHLLQALVNGYRLAGVLAVYRRMADVLADVRLGFDQPGAASEMTIRRYRGRMRRSRPEGIIAIRISWPDPALNPNSRANRYAKLDAANAMRTEAWAEATNARLNRPDWQLPARPMLCIYMHPPSESSRNDVDNLHAALKWAIDGMCQALGFDDNRLKDQIQRWGEPVEGGQIILQIRTADGLSEFLGLC